MTTKPMSAEDFAQQIGEIAGIEQDFWHELATRIEARDQALTAPLMERIKVLEKLVYVPGMWKCAKCSLVVTSNYLHAETGNVSANNDPQKCLNGCGPMWRVTERDSGNEMSERCLEETKSTNNLRERIRVLEEALLPLAKVADAIGENMERHFGIWSQTSNFKEDTRLLISDARKAREVLQTTAEGEA